MSFMSVWLWKAPELERASEITRQGVRTLEGARRQPFSSTWTEWTLMARWSTSKSTCWEEPALTSSSRCGFSCGGRKRRTSLILSHCDTSSNPFNLWSFDFARLSANLRYTNPLTFQIVEGSSNIYQLILPPQGLHQTSLFSIFTWGTTRLDALCILPFSTKL